MSTNQHEDDAGPMHGLVAHAFEVELRRRGDVVGAMQAICDRLGVALSRWVGADGWHALLGRALAETDRARGETGLSLDVLGRLQGGAAGTTRSSCEHVLVGVATVLGRFIGDALARRLIEQGLAVSESGSPGGSHHG